ncbi:hypothetical protein ACFXPN_11420 [Streptomyces griseorubiginosus]|uniref:hypothetical protein n=1 Tax=Streptomyces griseorubiginosus TaxID=67304 RepID=UPI0036C0FFC2
MPTDTSAGGAGTNGTDTEGWGTLRQAADMPRGQLKRPGDYHWARAAHFVGLLGTFGLLDAQRLAIDLGGTEALSLRLARGR